MTAPWFISDTHFYHGNIITYCGRPFKDRHHMNEVMIEKWNAKVKPDDVIWHLGDFGFSGDRDLLGILDRLHGKKMLVAGNHDKVILKARSSRFHGRFEAIVDRQELAGPNGERIELCHYPLYDNPSRHFLREGGWMLHGHKHGQGSPKAYRMLDCGVDVHAYQPISLAEVAQIMAARKDYAWDHRVNEDEQDQQERAARRKVE